MKKNLKWEVQIVPGVPPSPGLSVASSAVSAPRAEWTAPRRQRLLRTAEVNTRDKQYYFSECNWNK